MSDGYFRGRPKRSSLFGICTSSHVVRHLPRFSCFLSLLEDSCSFLDITLSSHPSLSQPPPEGAIIILLYDLRSSCALPFPGSPSQHKEIRNGFVPTAWFTNECKKLSASQQQSRSHIPWATLKIGMELQNVRCFVTRAQGMRTGDASSLRGQ